MLVISSDIAALLMLLFIIYLIRYVFKDYKKQDMNPHHNKNIIGKDIDLHGKPLH